MSEILDCGDAGKVVHCKRAPFDIMLGMAPDPTGYCLRGLLGNPFTHLPLETTRAKFQVATREEAIRRFEEYARGRILRDSFFRLAVCRCYGKTVACWCAPKACHGVTVLKLAAEILHKPFAEPQKEETLFS